MKIFYYILGFLFIIAGVVVAFVLTKKKAIQKHKNDIIKLFEAACKQKNITEYTLKHVKKDTHDFYFEDEKSIYYIKVIYNFSNHEICINNAIKWQLRKISDREENLTFVDGVEALMRLDLTNPEKKEHKLFIVYPNVTALLKVINECEMVFVYPDTDVYGAKVIPYKKLVEQLDLLDI